MVFVALESRHTPQCGGASSCSQTRTFSYNSLSRLTSAANPESGTILYEYDNNGNLTKKTDAREIETTYTYDALNRVTARDYDDSTPDVDYTYGTTAPKIGKLTKVESSVSTTEYTSFDILGRVTASKQTTDGVTYGNGTTDSPMTYTYNLGGAMVEQQYPSGRVVKNVLDGNGDLETVKSKKNANFGFHDYAKNFTYNAAGAVTKIQLGNGRWESTVFNSRLQPTQVALGTVQNGTDKLKLEYGYGTTSANNGNVSSQKITVVRPGQADLVFDQTYSYDELNRLKVAEEKTGTTTNWKQTFTFDRYGNRRFDQSNTTFPESFANPNLTNPTFNASNNKFESGQSWTYDTAGNVTVDPDGRTFTYDAENKQVEAKNSTSATLGTYYFDGDGKRIKKIVPSSGETTIFVYDAGGKLIAEYSTTVATPETAKVQYLTHDNLGTPRINTDANGAITSRSDYLPYGDEIVSLGGRSSSDKYVADDVRQGFTGYENDGETGLDYAQARMYAKGVGRFHSVDPENYGASEDDPQSWNGYAYSRNNPVLFTDPTGQEYVICEPNGKNCRTYSDKDAMKFKNDPAIGRFVGGFDGDTGLYSGKIVDPVTGTTYGTVTQTSIDDPIRQMLVGGRPVAEGAQTPLTILATILSFFTGGFSGGLARNMVTPAATKAVPAAAATAATTATIHGTRQLAVRGFTQAEVAATRTGTQMLQRDGARVFLKEIAPGKYNVIVEGERGVVTALKNISWKSVTRLAQNYGWYSPIK